MDRLTTAVEVKIEKRLRNHFRWYLMDDHYLTPIISQLYDLLDDDDLLRLEKKRYGSVILALSTMEDETSIYSHENMRLKVFFLQEFNTSVKNVVARMGAK